MSCITKKSDEEDTQQREQALKVMLAGHKEEGKKKDTLAPLWRARTYVGWEVRGGRLGDEVTSQTQAIKKITGKFSIKRITDKLSTMKP